MIKRYTIVDTTLAVRDIKVEDIVDGVVVGVNNYTVSFSFVLTFIYYFIYV